MEVILGINVYIYTSRLSWVLRDWKLSIWRFYTLCMNFVSNSLITFNIHTHSLFLLILFCRWFQIYLLRITVTNETCLIWTPFHRVWFNKCFVYACHGFSLFRAAGFGWHGRGSFYPRFKFSYCLKLFRVWLRHRFSLLKVWYKWSWFT